jgi:hypothetical protein
LYDFFLKAENQYSFTSISQSRDLGSLPRFSWSFHSLELEPRIHFIASLFTEDTQVIASSITIKWHNSMATLKNVGAGLIK